MRRLGGILLNLVQIAFLVVWCVAWIPLAMLVALFSSEASLRLGRVAWGPGLVWAARSPVTLVPGAAFDCSTPHLYLMNHQSMFDIPLAFTCIPANLRFVAKHTLKYVPLVGWYMALSRMIFVDRSDRAAAVRSLERAGALIRAGANVLAFPEGTRSRDGSILPFKKGIFVVAMAAKVPIVPVAVEGSGQVFAADSMAIRPHPCRLRIGEPIDPTPFGDDREALMRRVRDALIDLHVSIGGAGGDRENAIAAPGREGDGRAEEDQQDD